ncbi:MAG: sialidase family protein [Opitutales bacterium]|nr:sialidase family protein [Opitutales bacterium]
MNFRYSPFIALSLLTLGLIATEPTATIPTTPQYRIEETIVSYRGTGTMDYLGFPAIVPSGENQIMLSYKRGTDHGWDPGAMLEITRFDLESGRTIQDPIQIGIPDRIMEMGEWVRFPDGTLGTYIDAQKTDEDRNAIRIGLRGAISRDNGKSFGPLERVGVIDGVEYGYLFNSVIVGQRLYALIMTFEYLAGGRRSVDALYTDDNGATWHFIRNLSEEFGDIRINESSLITYENGFLVATRGYDNIQRIHQVDISFKLIKEANLTENTPSMGSYIGRPRLFTYGGNYFLSGRNWRGPNREIPMELALIRFDPESLMVEKHFVLDNEEQGKVTDGYYTCPILVNTGEHKLLNIFTYKGIFGNSPDILRLQFDSEEFLRKFRNE